ncbi:uncharacterized protein LOC125074320 [Vanessa atalanta]|uniref:uncharacterized protein LOC125074320 n=1 Tax=Vanessa atalanta TaxID=42275 RepID=UPI001FCCD782|nr:uncharacterized protein LOC125074320 [Vanessa atalanta]
MEMLRAALILLVLCIVNTTFAQYRLQESLSPQALRIQRQGYNVPATISSLDFLSTPQTQIPRPRYGFKKTSRKNSKVAKRQYLAEVFKQSAIKNMVAAANACSKNAVNLPLSNQLTYQNNVASDISKWRL